MLPLQVGPNALSRDNALLQDLGGPVVFGWRHRVYGLLLLAVPPVNALIWRRLLRPVAVPLQLCQACPCMVQTYGVEFHLVLGRFIQRLC